jgi:hypothetical protein
LNKAQLRHMLHSLWVFIFFMFLICCLYSLRQYSTLPDDSAINTTATATAAISDVEKCLAACGLSQLELNSAQYQSGSSSLVKLVQNLHAVSRILEKLHLPGYQKLTTATFSYTFPDGTKITLGQVLLHFKWTIQTYQKKSAAYSWAVQAASWSYVGAIPGNHSFIYDLF